MRFLGQDRTRHDRTRRHFPKMTFPKTQDTTKRHFPKWRFHKSGQDKMSFSIMQIRQSVPRIVKFHRKNHQTLRPNANSPTRVHDSKEWYFAAVTSVIIENKQRKWAKEAARNEYRNFTERSL